MSAAPTTSGARGAGPGAPATAGLSDSRRRLRNLLTLLHDADRLVDTFVGEVRDWADPGGNIVVASQAAQLDGRPRIRAAGTGLFPRQQETRRRVWFKRPQLLRVELLRGGRLVRLGVRDGWRWSIWDNGQEATAASGEHADRAIPPLLDPAFLSPARLVGLFQFESVGEETRLGRRVLVARATRRDRPPEVDNLSYEFEVDAKHGAVLRSAAFNGDRCVRLTEAVDAQFGVTIDPERFLFRDSGAPG